MSRKYDVTSADGKAEPQVKKCVALLLVRRQLAIVVKPFHIKKLAKSGMKAYVAPIPRCKVSYEHHIEPKLERFGQMDTEWLLYLNGYTPISE